MATTSTSTSGNGSHAKDQIDREFENLKGDISKLTEQVGTLLASTGSAAYRRARIKADSVIKDATGKGHDAVDAVKDVTTTIGDAVEEAVYKRPVTTLAMAVGIGFLIGAIWRR
jgi:ElaB/YqjD/DUF883 family membrane-anchored ribosome-binding protein